MPYISQPEPSDITQACETGSISNLAAWKRSDLLPAMSRDELYACVRIAIIYDQLSVLRWLCEDSGYSLDFWGSPNSTEDIDEDIDGHLDGITALAATYSRLDILKWLAFDFEPITSTLRFRRDDFSTMLLTAIENGHIDIVKWYLTELGPVILINPGHERVLNHSVLCGELEITQWLVTGTGWTIDLNAELDYLDPVQPVALAAGGGHLELVRWMVLDSGHVIDILKGEPNALDTAREIKDDALIHFLETVEIVQNRYGLEAVPQKMKELETAAKKGTRRTGGRGGM